MTVVEFVEWQEFARYHPFPEDCLMLSAAIQSSVIANSNRNPRKQPRPYSASDFMPRFKQAGRRSGTKGVMSASEWENTKTLAKAMFGAK